MSCHACPTREWVSDALLWQRTPQPPAFNAAGGLASGRRLVPVGHVAVPDPGGRQPRPQGHVAVPDPCPSWERRSGGRPCGTRGGAGPWGRRPRPQGLARAPDSYPNRVLGPGPLAGSTCRGPGPARGGSGPVRGGPNPWSVVAVPERLRPCLVGDGTPV